ncbi:isoprenoid biosynthesis glyoxalase ElbB [Desulfuromonas sp. TF]|uniref:isoprenoid biosynthesis glyoxalase ElbB n=1 Tax=Desulfuromonas sp. TF TaxID=1232410 RepID=UPI000400FADC|nr:isoprenoid biosynthesis glyoxalase ElbB [Desulfuromonas sp. TF]
MKKQIGVVLSGCGVYDGSEIHESVLTLLTIDQLGAEAICMAPDVELEEIDHLTGRLTGIKRNVLVESARIARGRIRDIASVKVSDLDAIIFPGGFGAAKNLSNFATNGVDAIIDPEVSRLLRGMAAEKKPIGAICIAPVLIAATLGRDYSPCLTIGTDTDVASAILSTGSRHSSCAVTGSVVDQENKIITTPAYMLAERISEISEGITKTVRALLELTEAK